MSNPAAVIPPSVTSPEITERLCIAAILPHTPRGFHDGNQSLFQNDEKKIRPPPSFKAVSHSCSSGEARGREGLELYSPISPPTVFKGGPKWDNGPSCLLSAGGEEQHLEPAEQQATDPCRKQPAPVLR